MAPEPMRAAAAVVVLAIAACGSGGRDPIVGRWGNERGRTIEFRADGKVDLPINAVETSCSDAADVIAACAARYNRWARHGDRYQLAVPAVRRAPRGSSFDPQTPCACGSETVDVTLRGDELRVVDSDERLQRLP